MITEDGLLEDLRGLRQEMLNIFTSRVWGVVTYLVLVGVSRTLTGFQTLSEFTSVRCLYLAVRIVDLKRCLQHNSSAGGHSGGIYWESNKGTRLRQSAHFPGSAIFHISFSVQCNSDLTGIVRNVLSVAKFPLGRNKNRGNQI